MTELPDGDEPDRFDETGYVLVSVLAFTLGNLLLGEEPGLPSVLEGAQTLFGVLARPPPPERTLPLGTRARLLELR